MSNYTKISEKYIEEIDANFVTYEHNKTKAKVATIACDDDNKVFTIAFRTPPIDNSGLTHILEHSVLCGSDKYPLKDPFVELLKSSLNTFLNAMTFYDKTVYPVASKNLKDFKNLMDVYLDAVFHPNIYKHKEIFEQEGWHYHLENRSDDIEYNGVVYNEMKGAFSDPEDTLFRLIKKTLFPETAYGFESGGDPKYIPDLTYEKFLDFHSKYYSASNSYIYIYGNCDMEERLDYLDKEYLSKMDYVEFDTTLKIEPPFKRPKYKSEYYSNDDVNNKTFLSYNIRMPEGLDTRYIMALDILITSLFNVTGAPIKEAIIKEKLGDDVDVTFDVEMLEPIISIVVSGASSANEERFIEVIDKKLSELIKKGFDKKSILSIINHEEFLAREKSFSPHMPKGLMVTLNSLTSWLYDDNDPTSNVEVIKYFSQMKEDLENGVFEELALKLILNSNNKSFVKLNPVKDYDLKEKNELKEKLKKYKDSLSEDELSKIVRETQALSDYQSKPDGIDALNSLPKLELSDIDALPEELKLEVREEKYKVLYSDYHTNGISYIKYYFDISDINDKDFSYLNLYTSLLLKLSTKRHSYYELNEIIRNNVGRLSFSLASYKKENKEVVTSFNISGAALDNKIDYFYEILNEVINDTLFTDTKRMYEVISELRSNIENSIVGRGSLIALVRAQSFDDYYSYLSDLAGGIGYIDFIRYVYDNFDNIKDELVNRFEGYKRLLTKKNIIVGYCGNNYSSFIDYSNKYYESLGNELNYEKSEFVPKIYKEAIKTPFNVNFVSRVGKFNGYFSGYYTIMQNLLGMDYLWDRIRVHGGAYGANIRITSDGYIGYTSYRDPNIDSTDKVYNEVCDYIDNINLDEEALTRYKIGTFGMIQSVLHNKDKAELARTLYLKDITYDIRKKQREEILEATLSDIKNLSSSFKEALESSSLCVIGAKDSIEKSELKFDDKRNL